MPKSKKQKHRRRKTFKRKAKPSERAGMDEPLSFFADFSSAKNSMIGANKAEKLKDMIFYTKKDISELEEDANLLKAYLRYNKNRKTKVMPAQEVKDILEGKDLYDMPEPTPRREAQRYYDLLQDQYHEYDYHLKKKRRYLKKMNQYLKGVESYHKHAKEHEKRIRVYKPDVSIGKN